MELRTQDTVLVRFMLCETEKQANEIISETKGNNLFTALVDVNGDYQDVSKNATSLTGYDKSALLKDSLFRMIHRNDKAELFKAFSVAMTDGATFRFHQRIKCFNGQYLPVITHLKKVESSKHYAVVFCLMVRA
jgi:PAS domain S-box-containing protein